MRVDSAVIEKTQYICRILSDRLAERGVEYDCYFLLGHSLIRLIQSIANYNAEQRYALSQFLQRSMSETSEISSLDFHYSLLGIEFSNSRGFFYNWILQPVGAILIRFLIIFFALFKLEKYCLFFDSVDIPFKTIIKLSQRYRLIPIFFPIRFFDRQFRNDHNLDGLLKNSDMALFGIDDDVVLFEFLRKYIEYLLTDAIRFKLSCPSFCNANVLTKRGFDYDDGAKIVFSNICSNGNYFAMQHGSNLVTDDSAKQWPEVIFSSLVLGFGSVGGRTLGKKFMQLYDSVPSISHSKRLSHGGRVQRVGVILCHQDLPTECSVAIFNRSNKLNIGKLLSSCESVGIELKVRCHPFQSELDRSSVLCRDTLQVPSAPDCGESFADLAAWADLFIFDYDSFGCVQCSASCIPFLIVDNLAAVQRCQSCLDIYLNLEIDSVILESTDALITKILTGELPSESAYSSFRGSFC